MPIGLTAAGAGEPDDLPPIGPIVKFTDLLTLTAGQLDALFRAGTAATIPNGVSEGEAIVAPGTSVTDELAKFVHIFAWKGKVFEPDTVHADHGWLKNRIGILGNKAIVADVSKGTSWFDGKPCIVLDYSHTSLVAQWIRDEIREVAPGVFLGLVFWGKEQHSAHRLIHFALQF